jgi:hypothetical protein
MYSGGLQINTNEFLSDFFINGSMTLAIGKNLLTYKFFIHQPEWRQLS